MGQPKHRDVNGRCPTCGECWPCLISKGEPVGAVDQWAADSMLQESLIESNRRLEVNRRVNRMLKMLGVKLEVHDFCTGIMVDTDILLQLLERVSEEEVIA